MNDNKDSGRSFIPGGRGWTQMRGRRCRGQLPRLKAVFSLPSSLGASPGALSCLWATTNNMGRKMKPAQERGAKAPRRPLRAARPSAAPVLLPTVCRRERFGLPSSPRASITCRQGTCCAHIITLGIQSSGVRVGGAQVVARRPLCPTLRCAARGWRGCLWPKTPCSPGTAPHAKSHDMIIILYTRPDSLCGLVGRAVQQRRLRAFLTRAVYAMGGARAGSASSHLCFA